MKRAGILVAFLVVATLTIMDGAHYICRDCGAKLANQTALTWHNEQSASCRAVRAMKAAEELARLGESGPSAVLEDDNDFDAPEGPFYDEREAMPEIINEHALNSDSDDSDEEDECAQVVGDGTAKRKFDSELKTLLWFNTAGPKNTALPKRSRETWLQLMKDDRYRLQKVLNAWNSASDMEKCIRKAAVGEVRRASTMQAVCLTRGFSLVGTFEFFGNQARGPSAETPCKRFN
jgi:hypothetical protein